MQTLKNYIKVEKLTPSGARALSTLDANGSPLDTKGLVAATGSVTIATNPSNGHTVQIGTKVYTFKSALSTGPGVDGEVKIGASAAATLTNLKNAINRDGSGTPDTDFPAETVRHATVIAGTIASTVLPLTARAKGAAGNDIALVDGMSGSGNVVSGSTLTGGRDGEQFDAALVRISVGAISGSPDTVEFEVEECDSPYFSSGVTTAEGGDEFEAAANTDYTLQIRRTKKYLRLVTTITGGTDPTVVVSAEALLNNWAKPFTLA